MERSAKDVAISVRRLDLVMSQLRLGLSERLGLSAVEVLALAHLSLEGALGPTDLGHRLHMTTGAVTALLDRLALADFVVREPHPTDRRRIVVRLTPAGRERLFGNVHDMANQVIALTERLSSGEREIVGRFLEELCELIVSPPKTA